MATPVKQEHGWGLSLFIGAWIFSVESVEFIRYLESWLCLCHCQGCNPACGELPTCLKTVSSSCETKVSRQLGIAKPQHSFFSTTTMNLLELLDTLTRTTRHHFSIQFKEMYGNVWNCCVHIPEKHLPAPDKICRCHPPEVYIELRATLSNL